MSKPGSAAGTKGPQDNVTTSLKKGGKGAIGPQTSVEDSTDTINELGKVSEWLSTGVNGKRILTQSNGTPATLDNILCSLATCRHTKQVIGTFHVLHEVIYIVIGERVFCEGLGHLLPQFSNFLLPLWTQI